jgi:hypothetical protein
MANKTRIQYKAEVDKGRKRVLAIVAGILVARHLKTTEDLFDTRDTPRTRSMVIAAVHWAKRIMERLTRSAESKAKNIGITSSEPLFLTSAVPFTEKDVNA